MNPKQSWRIMLEVMKISPTSAMGFATERYGATSLVDG
jgi:hypothetical protein